MSSAHRHPRPTSETTTDGTERSDLRAAAEALLCEVTGAVRVVRLCPVCGSAAHGQPRLVGSPLAVSLSYADGLVAVAWGTGPAGIDIEHLDKLGERARPGERTPSLSRGDLLRWTRIEALAKAAGTGLRTWPATSLPDLPTRRLTLPDGYVGTLAGDGEVRLAGPAAASP